MKAPRASPDWILRREQDDWGLLYNPDTGRTFGLDPIGMFFWERLDGQRSPEQLLDELGQQCTELPPQAGQHLSQFLAQLTEKGMLVA